VTGRTARTCGLLLLALLATLAACGGDEDGAASGAGEVQATGPSLDADAAAALLADSWMVHAANDPAGVTALLDAPGGEGWLALFHNDLAGARTTFERADSSSARLGLARVHLARADVLRVGGALHREAALDLARYRRDHHEGVRTGPYSLLLASLIAIRAEAPADERAAFVEAAAGDPTAEADAAVVDRLRAMAQGQLPAGGPEPLATRLAFIAAMNAGDLAAATPLLGPVHSREPDLRDPLGEDAEAGLRFEGLFHDPLLLEAIGRHHLAQAWIAASAIEGPGEAIAAAVEAAWGGPLPEAIRDAALPASTPLPAWTALFAGPAVDRADWDAYWADASSPFLDRLATALPDAGLGQGSDTLEVDAAMRTLAELEDVFAAAVAAGAPPDGAALASDLELATPAIDRALRARMVGLVQADAATQAKRLGDRSLDANPGARGGASDSARTRVSYRNDRAFLLRLAHCLWRAGQTGAALDLVHPLVDEDPALQPVKHYLGQLDAASTIGLQGKTSQL
jgi:hypothetical protein